MPDRFGRGFEVTQAHHWVGGVVMLVMFAVLIGVIVWAVLRITRAEAAKQAMPVAGAPPLPVARAEDPALATLRLRYAQGEIDRDEFVRVSTDLGSPQPPESP
jgi:uncharacterized membrane protein